MGLLGTVTTIDRPFSLHPKTKKEETKKPVKKNPIKQKVVETAPKVDDKDTLDVVKKEEQPVEVITKNLPIVEESEENIEEVLEEVTDTDEIEEVEEIEEIPLSNDSSVGYSRKKNRKKNKHNSNTIVNPDNFKVN